MDPLNLLEYGSVVTQDGEYHRTWDTMNRARHMN